MIGTGTGLSYNEYKGKLFIFTVWWQMYYFLFQPFLALMFFLQILHPVFWIDRNTLCQHPLVCRLMRGAQRLDRVSKPLILCGIYMCSLMHFLNIFFQFYCWSNKRVLHIRYMDYNNNMTIFFINAFLLPA